MSASTRQSNMKSVSIHFTSCLILVLYRIVVVFWPLHDFGSQLLKRNYLNSSTHAKYPLTFVSHGTPPVSNLSFCHLYCCSPYSQNTLLTERILDAFRQCFNDCRLIRIGRGHCSVPRCLVCACSMCIYYHLEIFQWVVHWNICLRDTDDLEDEHVYLEIISQESLVTWNDVPTMPAKDFIVTMLCELRGSFPYFFCMHLSFGCEF